MSSEKYLEAQNKLKGAGIDSLCVKCGSKMLFSCAEPELDKPDFEHQVYECAICRSTQSFVTAR